MFCRLNQHHQCIVTLYYSLVTCLQIHCTEHDPCMQAQYPNHNVTQRMLELLNKPDLIIILLHIQGTPCIPSVPNPSCRHTTVASLLSHLVLHTLPHCPPKQSSTLPWFPPVTLPYTNLILPGSLHSKTK